MKIEDIEVGQRVKLTILPMDRDEADLDYLLRRGKYAAPIYGPTESGQIMTVESVDWFTWRKGQTVDQYPQVTLTDESGDTKLFLAFPEELELA